MLQPRSILHSELRTAVLDDADPEALWPGEWEDLATRSAAATTFVSRPWVSSWLEVYAAEKPLKAIELRADGTLVGALWLYRLDDPAYGSRWLTVGSGNSDRLDPLLDAAFAEPAARALIDALTELSADAPVELQQVSPDSVFARVAANDARCSIVQQDTCLVVDLRDVGDALHLLKKGMRYDLRRSRRLLQEHGGKIREAAPGATDGLIDALVQLHTARWRARGEPGVLADEASRALHRSVARRMAGKGLVLRALEINSRIVACVYGFRSNGREMCYLTGFDPAWSWLQPGKLMLADAIDRAIAAGSQCFDMLRGREDYKYRWPVIEEPCIRISIGSNHEEPGRTLDHR